MTLEEKILLRDGEIVPLTAKVIDLLSVLVKSRAAVVSRDELMNAVWPESFVEESNLTESIYTLRRTLGNFDGKPIIETLPKRGYRMTVAVDHLTQSAADEPLSKENSNALLEQLEGHPEQRALNQILLRSMMQAVYSSQNDGHYGLGAQDYLHFTSPIRRFTRTCLFIVCFD